MDPKDVRPTIWPEEFDAGVLLRRLAQGNVDYVVIGGIALVIHGSARLTRDLDIVLSPEEPNLRALGEVLVELKARLRGIDEDVPFVPDARTLGNVDLLTLNTEAGWLDVHRRPPGAPPYRTLRRRAEAKVFDGITVRVASPDDLLAMKRAAARPIDLSDVEELEAIKRLRGELGRA
jgi:nucleotidyltransferase AbiEii toxin of type IV toxin-antitoxin system